MTTEERKEHKAIGREKERGESLWVCVGVQFYTVIGQRIIF